MPFGLAGAVSEGDRKLFVAVRRRPQRQDQKPPSGFSALAGRDDAVPVLHRRRDRMLPAERDLGPLEMDLRERDLTRRRILKVMRKVQDREGDRIPGGTSPEFLLRCLGEGG